MLPVTCPHCGKKRFLRNVKKYEGKRVAINCANPSCLRRYEVLIEVPKATASGTVLINSDQLNYSKSGLLIYTMANKEVKQVPIGKGEHIIGRATSSPKADIALLVQDLNMSRKHCCITGQPFRDGLIFTITDLGSKNGVIINDKKLQDKETVYLQDGDRLKLGNTLLAFKYKG